MQLDIVKSKKFEEERPLFALSDATIRDCVFKKGESALKMCKNLKILNCSFEYKYPLWYSNNIEVKNSTFNKLSRSGIWHSANLSIENCVFLSPKNFRRASDITIMNCDFKDAKETLWTCSGVKLVDCKFNNADYIGFNSIDVKLENVEISGNYSFDGAKNLMVQNCRIYSKDAFWNTENVVVENSYIEGEYLAWNSRNIYFVNCIIKSTQGLCYCDNLHIENSDLTSSSLLFEYSNVDVNAKGVIKSILNPQKGRINADRILTLIIQNDKVNTLKTQINCPNIESTSDIIDWSDI